MRSCTRYREALSARLDGEDPGIPAERIDTHLDECADCRTWARAAGQVSGRLAGADTPAPRAAAIAGLLEHAGPPPTPQEGRLRQWRAAMAVTGTAQLLIACAGVFSDDGHTSAHTAHELTSWDLGLAVGFLLLAWLPSRAWGALPVIAVMVTFLAGTSVTDLAAGHAELAKEALHALQVAGLIFLWAIARQLPRTSVVVRLTSP